MANITRRSAIFSAIALASLVGVAHAGENPVYSNGAIAINGYDTVAYFTENAPVKGDPAIIADWNGATWLFSNEANKAAFVAAPEKYAPQYGGYCAYAVSKGATAKTEPSAFTIVDGKLYLNYSQDVRAIWGKDIAGNIANADENWPGVLK